jgi:hypothetical protein
MITTFLLWGRYARTPIEALGSKAILSQELYSFGPMPVKGMHGLSRNPQGDPGISPMIASGSAGS